MKREIKFKFWNPVHKEMMHVDGISLLGETILCGEVGRRPNDESLRLEEIVQLIPLQFTNRHDKNGKEICEADIVKNEFGKKIVVWSDSAAAFYLEEFEMTIMQIWFCSMDFDKIEIIGNIYENPELVTP